VQSEKVIDLKAVDDRDISAMTLELKGKIVADESSASDESNFFIFDIHFS
jgi:hypothetical protein